MGPKMKCKYVINAQAWRCEEGRETWESKGVKQGEKKWERKKQERKGMEKRKKREFKWKDNGEWEEKKILPWPNLGAIFFFFFMIFIIINNIKRVKKNEIT